MRAVLHGIRMVNAGLALWALLISTASPAQAQTFPTHSWLWNGSRLLPQGQSFLTVGGSIRSVDSRRSSEGRSIPLGQGYEQRVTWSDVVDSGTTSGKALRLHNYLESRGIDPSSEVALTEFAIEREEQRLEFTWAYGLTDQWMIGARLPLIHTTTRVHTSTRYNSQYRDLMANQLGQGEPDEELNLEIQSKTESAVQDRLQSQGFDPVTEEDQRYSVGDVQLLSQVLVGQSAQHVFALRQRLAVPTAGSSDPYSYIDSTAADGQLDLGLDAMWDWWIHSRVLVTTTLGYTFQMSDQVRARVPASDSRARGGEVDFEVERDLGDVFTASVQSEYRLNSLWRLGGGYTYFYKAEDRFEGQTYEQARYSLMSRETERQMQVARVGLAYFPAPFWARGDYENKLAAALNHYIVMSGINVADASTTTLDLTYYF